jgi:hypothetical protein
VLQNFPTKQVSLEEDLQPRWGVLSWAHKPSMPAKRSRTNTSALWKELGMPYKSDPLAPESV